MSYPGGQSGDASGAVTPVPAGRAGPACQESDFGILSERELEVLGLMAQGMSNKGIGRVLWISETTVKTHVSHILRKLGQSDRTGAVLRAAQEGLVGTVPGVDPRAIRRT